MKPFLIMAHLVVIHLTSYSQSTISITFDGSPYPPGSAVGLESWLESGMLFTPIKPDNQFVHANGGTSYLPENGSEYLIFALGNSLSGRSFNSGRFGLFSVDLSEFSTLYQFPKTIPFVGYLPDGKTVTTNFTTDGIMDGTGPLADFETFYFDERFADLIKFEVPDYGYALDNLFVFDVIPEPSPAGLLFLGGTVLGLLRLRKRHSY